MSPDPVTWPEFAQASLLLGNFGLMLGLMGALVADRLGWRRLARILRGASMVPLAMVLIGAVAIYGGLFAELWYG